MTDIMMPQLGETVTEGTVTRWLKQVGDEVALDEALFEVSTDKVDTEVPSPVAGVLAEILASEGDVVEVGQVLARVGSEAAAPVPEPPPPAPDPELQPPEPAPAPPAPAPDREPAAAEPAPATATPPAAAAARSAGKGMVLSPVVRRLIAESGIDPATITGTGRGGRITRSDVEQAIRARASAPADEPAAAPGRVAAEPPPAVPSPEPEPYSAATSPQAPAVPSPEPEPYRAAPSPQPPAVAAVVARSGDSVVPLNRIRRRTADHMVMSKQTSPHVLTAIEVDYEGVEAVRRVSKQAWKAAEGFSLTYLPFIARAVVDALRDYPHLNASFGDDELIVHSNVNLAIAVDIDFQGLLAPVIQGADGKRLRQIARDIVDLANRARSRKLSPDDLSGGTFTLTNAGQYGTMMQFPIINQPQVAILSTDGVTRKPVVVTDSFGNESIAIHSVGVLAMAWDHRAFDGAYAAAFLHRVKELIETRDWESEIR
jgi:2-oxoglutarate dehydrogenase E2 component (dihydrolipoamide succinyltransferase)